MCEKEATTSVFQFLKLLPNEDRAAAFEHATKTSGLTTLGLSLEALVLIVERVTGSNQTFLIAGGALIGVVTVVILLSLGLLLWYLNQISYLVGGVMFCVPVMLVVLVMFLPPFFNR